MKIMKLKEIYDNHEIVTCDENEEIDEFIYSTDNDTAKRKLNLDTPPLKKKKSLNIVVKY